MQSPRSAPPPRRHTSPTGRVVIPVLVVVLVIVVLGRPILISGLGLEEEEPAPVPAPTRPNDDEEEEGPSRLATPYPRACTRAASAPGLGLVAASQGDSIGVGTPMGQSAFALRAEPPIGFSASGGYLATAGADLWTSRGERVGLAFSRPATRWAWSPRGDCIAGIERGRLLVAQPGDRPQVLVRGVPVSNFAFAPDGTRIVFAVGGGSRATGIWMADLKSREIRSLQSSTGWTLTAWSRAARPILLREGSEGQPASREGLSFAPSDEVSYCGNEVVTIRQQRLATFGVSGVPAYIGADRRFRYSAVACSPDGDLLVAVRYPKGDPTSTTMAVLRPDGMLVREVAQESTIEDQPMWGPDGTGVVFVGGVSGEGSAGPLVWFLAEGMDARPTGLRVQRFGPVLDSWLDWSATRPLGHPTE